jgi:hypothetical protein
MKELQDRPIGLKHVLQCFGVIVNGYCIDFGLHAYSTHIGTDIHIYLAFKIGCKAINRTINNIPGSFHGLKIWNIFKLLC